MERPYVGIDLHRRRSVIYSMDGEGEKLDCVRIANDPLTLPEMVGKTGSNAEVVIEATYGWYWAVDLLQDAGFSVHVAHPSGNDWGNRRVAGRGVHCYENDARASSWRIGRKREGVTARPVRATSRRSCFGPVPADRPCSISGSLVVRLQRPQILVPPVTPGM